MGILEYESITAGQYEFLYNVLSFAAAGFLAGAIGLFVAAFQVGPRYRMAVAIAAIVSLIASYHYFQIFGSWGAAFAWTEGGLVKTDQPFNVAYRYADWLLTVPLLMIELVDILGLKRGQGRRLATSLGLLAALMIALGYPGETAESSGTMWTFWVLSMLPFLAIFGYLVTGFGKHVQAQPLEARGYISGARWLTASVWWIYPIIFLFPLIGWVGGSAIVTMNALYAVADLLAKVGLGILIAAAAFAKKRAEEGESSHGAVGGSSPSPATA